MGKGKKKDKKQLPEIRLSPDMRTRAEQKADPYNPKPVTRTTVGTVNYAENTLQALADQLRKKKPEMDSLVGIVVKNKDMGVSFTDISRMVGMTPDEVRKEYWKAAEEDRMTPEQTHIWVQRQLLQVVNYMTEQAAAGSTDATKQIVDATDKLIKLMELEKKTANDLLMLIGPQQGELLIRIVEHVVSTIMNVSQIRQLVPIEVVDAAAETALTEAKTLVDAAAEATID